MHSASDATPALKELLSPYELLGEMGTRPTPLYAVKHVAYGGKAKLLVAERFVGAGAVGDADAASFVAQARRLSTLASPNVGRVRELAVRGDDLVVFWDFVDGDKLERAWLARDMALDLALRFILDVLAGAGAIHALRDARQRPMQLAHGEISTATVVVGVDGAARLLHAIARRVPGAPAEPTSYGYLAPEVHAGEPYDARADVFSAGVFLWEALSGVRLFAREEPAAIVSHVKGGVARAVTTEATRWAGGLVAVAEKALAFSAADRWPSAGAMASEIRKAAGLKIASASSASAFAKEAMGARASARRQRLESGDWAAPPPSDRTPEATVPTVGPCERPALPSTAPVGLEIDPDMDVELLPESLPPTAPLAPAPPVAVIPPLPQRALRSLDAPAEIEVPISLAPPPASVAHPPTDSAAAWPTSEEHHDELEDPATRATRRRRTIVLSGVASVGLLVFALAGWRAAAHSAASPVVAAVPHPPAETAAPTIPATPTTPTKPTKEETQPGQTVLAADVVTTTTAATSTATPVKAPATARTTVPVAAAKPSPASGSGSKRKTPATPSHASRPHHSGFDPNSL